MPTQVGSMPSSIVRTLSASANLKVSAIGRRKAATPNAEHLPDRGAESGLRFHSLRDEVSRSGGVNVEDFAFTVGAPGSCVVFPPGTPRIAIRVATVTVKALQRQYLY